MPRALQGHVAKQPRYLLVEQLGNGARISELFSAPSDPDAIRRAELVVVGRPAELWRDDRIVWSWSDSTESAADC